MVKKQVEQEVAASAPQQMNSGIAEEKQILYVVVRDGYRVSDKEYKNPNDSSAIAERKYWSRVETKHSHGAPVEIVQYDSKLHRIW